MRIENAIICDEVRREHNGKHLILGVYPDNIVVSVFPTVITVAVWIQFYSDSDTKQKKFTLEMRIKDEKNRELHHGEGKMFVAKKSELITVSIPASRVEIENECELTFQFREGKQRWKTIKKIPVQLQPLP